MKTVIRHWRVTKGIAQHYKKGRPDEPLLRRYFRGSGFEADISLGVPGHNEVSERGGQTQCEIVDDRGNIHARAMATCSFSDAFSYKKGKAIAHGRAMKQLEQ